MMVMSKELPMVMMSVEVWVVLRQMSVSTMEHLMVQKKVKMLVEVWDYFTHKLELH